MNDKCKDCPKYQEKLNEILKVYSSGFDIMIEMNEFIKNCVCDANR